MSPGSSPAFFPESPRCRSPPHHTPDVGKTDVAASLATRAHGHAQAAPFDPAMPGI